jgi:hypothetical protein
MFSARPEGGSRIVILRRSITQPKKIILDSIHPYERDRCHQAEQKTGAFTIGHSGSRYSGFQLSPRLAGRFGIFSASV